MSQHSWFVTNVNIKSWKCLLCLNWSLSYFWLQLLQSHWLGDNPILQLCFNPFHEAVAIRPTQSVSMPLLIEVLFLRSFTLHSLPKLSSSYISLSHLCWQPTGQFQFWKLWSISPAASHERFQLTSLLAKEKLVSCISHLFQLYFQRERHCSIFLGCQRAVGNCTQSRPSIVNLTAPVSMSSPLSPWQDHCGRPLHLHHHNPIPQLHPGLHHGQPDHICLLITPLLCLQLSLSICARTVATNPQPNPLTSF